MKRKNKDEGGTERPKLVIQEGFVTQAENDVLAVALDVVAKVLARYEEAAIAAGRRPDTGPSVTLKINRVGVGWAVSAPPRDVAYGSTLEDALRNLAAQTDADALRREAKALRAKAEELDRQAAGMEWREREGENAQRSTLNAQRSTGETEGGAE
jgi:hypothetical protein